MQVVTANVNGIRAAARKGGLAELAAGRPDVLALQEVRATPRQLAAELTEHGFDGSAVVSSGGERPGRNGVAIVARLPLSHRRDGLAGIPDSGRWIEGVFDTASGPLTVVSAYVPKGADPDGLEQKRRFLQAMTWRLGELRARPGDGLVLGDLNVARTEADLRNWRARVGRSGFLEWERQILDSWEQAGWMDLGRSLAGPGPGPYTWWSQRGRAFDNDTGWRIDYVWATPGLGARAVSARVARAPSWDARWSDHAPVWVTFA